MTRPVIFVLDDEPLVSRTLALVLQMKGYNVTHFLHPLEALHAIREHPPDILLADVELPSMTGIDLAITIREEEIPTRVLLLSGRTNTSEYIEQAAQRGYEFNVLAKPVMPQQLLSHVQQMLDEFPE